jgi:archaellum component FlaC
MKHEFEIKMGGEIRKDIKPERINYITEEVAYWRKFNALHGWFVGECGGGVDECQEIYVENGKLEELLGTLKKIQTLLNNSKMFVKTKDGYGQSYDINVYECEDEVRELLSPTSGFFFGSDEVDEYYKEEVDRTIEIIENLFKEMENEDAVRGLYSGEFYYRASW